MSDINSYEWLYKEHPRRLIPELCKQFYDLGWVTGTGGGISIKHGCGKGNEDVTHVLLEHVPQIQQRKILQATVKHLSVSWPPIYCEHFRTKETISAFRNFTLNLDCDEIFIAPSGVQKERIQPGDIFVVNADGCIISSPAEEKKLKISECTPLFMNAYHLRNAGAVLHSHSKSAVLATLIYPGSEFVITYQEMIKGIIKGNTGLRYRYDDKLVVPIIENTPFEKDLKDRMAAAMKQYPETSAILVRRHGVYVWGETWEKAKTMAECFDYLFDIAVQMKLLGLDPSKPPNEIRSY